MTRIIRVFPRRTKATPTDDLAFVGSPLQTLFRPEADRVMVSVTFTYDIPAGERLAAAWAKHYSSVELGGPAFGKPSGEFVPERFLKPGYVITSRGCPNKCWFCSVPKREGAVREYSINDGWNILDDNLLACSEKHIRGVFEMLSRQRRRAQFTGGLEARRLKDWHVELLSQLHPKQLFFAYDTPDDYEPLIYAARKLFSAGFTPTSKQVRCYVLIGFPGDTMRAARSRLKRVLNLGVTPMAMLWRNDKNETTPAWRNFQRPWARPSMIKLPKKFLKTKARR